MKRTLAVFGRADHPRVTEHLAWMLRTVLIVMAVTLAGCGGGNTPRPPTPAPQKITVCSGMTDRCQTLTPSRLPKGLQAPAGGKFPDVSSYQGHPDWGAAKRWGIVGAVVKAGEYVEDPDFAWNWGQLRALHIWHAPYWFVRNTGCQNEGAQIVSVIRAAGGLDSGPVVLDIEQPEANGYTPCLDAAVFAAFHRHAVVYTAPGTWPGGSGFGSLPLWQATYGSGFTHFWEPVLAWQCTDGVLGCVTYVPGIGYGDVSIDYGITRLTPTPARTWLREGDRGRNVYLLGHRLFVAGWLAHDGGLYYSHHLAVVVKAFQRKHGLKPATGITGSRTWTSIRVVAYWDKRLHRHDVKSPL